MTKLEQLFALKKPVLAMIHMAGDTQLDKIDRALKELELYSKHKVDGAIVEDYHGMPRDVHQFLKELNGNYPIPIGINLLRDPVLGFKWAIDYNLHYVQFDSIYKRDLEIEKVRELKKHNPEILVLGGVRFKYIPATGRTLQEDIAEGLNNCDCIVTTGDGTGITTDINKLKEYKKIMPQNVDLIVGAGVSANTAYEQLSIADSVIVGSYLKNGDTQKPISEINTAKFMNEIFRLRKDLL